MQIILSPAKIMLENEKNNMSDNSSINLSKETREIIDYLQSLTKEDFSKKLKIKGDILDLNYDRIINFKEKKYYPAIYLYGGMVYKNIDIQNIENKDYIKDHVTILSAMYGPINSFQAIKPYRLDFSNRIKIKDKNLKDIWKKSYNNYLNKENIILNLASNEFSSLIDKSKLKWIDFSFYRMGDNKELKSHSTISKKARGLMVKYLANNNITKNIEDIKKFNYDGFSYSYDLSDSNHLVFIKK